MSKEDIKHSSRPFLNCIYQKYVNRAYENLGVSPNEDGEQSDNLDEYPSEFKVLNKKEREEFEKNDKRTQDEFLSQFPSL